jgi:sirohydrochlorin ferrochelatase
VSARLVVAAHGTRSATGTATTRAFASALAAARPAVPVDLGFLDVASPSLADVLDARAGEDVVVVPLLLAAGYHVRTDIPAVVAGRRGVRVAAHLGPNSAVIDAVLDRLMQARSAERGATTVLAAVPSSQPGAQEDVTLAAERLAERLGHPVGVLPLGRDMAGAVEALPQPVEVAVYLLAEGGFLSSLRATVAGRGVVAEPIGVHPAVVSLVWARYDAALR